MYKSIIKKLRCPQCIKGLTVLKETLENDEIIEGVLACQNDHEWKIHEGVLDFNSREQEAGNNWSDMYEKYDYKELDAYIMSNVPPNQLKGYQTSFDYLEEKLFNDNESWVIDIATGRGMLLVEMVKRLKTSINMVCTDLSHMVLKYDRLKCLELNPDVKINYIACDATNLPFIDDSMDQAISFFGISNMGDFADKGIIESSRVARGGLLNVGIVIKDDNPKVETLNKVLKDAGHEMTLDACFESNFKKMHQLENHAYKVTNVFEAIGEESPHDMIPIEGEWFAIAAAEVRKSK